MEHPHDHHAGPLAVLICGTFYTNKSSPMYALKRDNPFEVNQVLEKSPMETWLRLKRTPGAVHMFSCTDEPLQSASFPWTAQWTFSSESQFARIYDCLQRIEPDLTKPRHSAYLRLRPDSVVLGSLPNPLLPDPSAIYTRWRVYNFTTSRFTQMRDSMECGVCDQFCECAQRKYGQVLFHTNGNCTPQGVPTDRVFLFGRQALLPVLRALLNYSSPGFNHPARFWHAPGRCVDVGRMVETGFGRVLEDQAVPILQLPFRTTLSREIQPETPAWASLACMLTWGDAPVPCSQPCRDASSISENKSVPWMQGDWMPHGRGGTSPTGGCNPVNKK